MAVITKKIEQFNPERPSDKTANFVAAACCLAPLVFSLIWVFVLLWEAYVLTFLWEWYVNPIFELSLLSLHYAFGLVLVVRLVTTQVRAKDTESWLLASILRPAVILLIGYLAHYYV